MAALSGTRLLKEKIPGLLDVQAGANRHYAHQGYTYEFVMRFVDDEHLQAYSPNPAHRAVSSQLRQLCETLLSFDIPQE